MDESTDNVLNLLKNIVRVATVTAVNNEEHIARVKFKDTAYTSDWLRVLDNRPFIPWYDVEQRTEYVAGGAGAAAYENHAHSLEINQWMPVVNQTVLTLYIPVDDGDGYIIGGM